jgi:hypothetical protein
MGDYSSQMKKMNPRIQPLLRPPRLPKGYQGIIEEIPYAIKYRFATIGYILILFIVLVVFEGIAWMMGYRNGFEAVVLYQFLLILWFAWENRDRQGIHLLCILRTRRDDIIFNTGYELFIWCKHTLIRAIVLLIIGITINLLIRGFIYQK